MTITLTHPVTHRTTRRAKVLHSPLTVVERSEHSFDPFPDRGRVLPWGVG